MKLLVPIDGSDTSLRAIDTLLAKLDAYRPPVEVHLVLSLIHISEPTRPY